MSNKAEEIGLSKLSIGSISPAEELDQAQKLADVLRTMAGVVADHRSGSVHQQSSSVLPERPTPPASKGNGWQDRVPLSSPDGVAQCDRIADYFAAQDKAKK